MKIWVVMQHRDGKLHPMSREALAAGQQLAGAEDGASTVDAVVFGGGDGVGAVAAGLTGLDLGAVRVVDHPALADYTPGAYVGALASAVADAGVDVLVFPHTYQTVEYAPRLAQAIGGTMVPEVVSFRREAGEWIFRRPVFGGKLQSDNRVRGDGPLLLSVQSGAFSPDGLVSGSTTQETLAVTAEIVADRELLGVEEVAGEHVDLSAADVIVAVGRGVGDGDKLAPVRELARELGGEIGASRPVIDSGWLERDRQIGSSGQTVAPKLYLALGISGAIQHLVGMKGAQTVVAVNKDPSAPIFGIADYGVVGDLHELVPALAEAVREAKSS